jgi:hypothetical protein
MTGIQYGWNGIIRMKFSIVTIRVKVQAIGVQSRLFLKKHIKRIFKMRWNTNKHNPGQERIIKRFALLPKLLDDDYKVFLEFYYVKQEWNCYATKQSCWVDKETWHFKGRPFHGY